jgi:hypothetical protein
LLRNPNPLTAKGAKEFRKGHKALNYHFFTLRSLRRL